MASGYSKERAVVLAVIAVLAVTLPLDGAVEWARPLIALACLGLALRSPCKAGAAYPFRHGFRQGAGCSTPAQPDAGTTSAGEGEGTAPSTRLSATLTTPEATSRSARG